MAILFVRVIVLLLATGAGIALGPAVGISAPWPFLGAGGLAVGLLALSLELGVRRVPMERLFVGALGGLFGLILAQALGTLFTALLQRAESAEVR